MKGTSSKNGFKLLSAFRKKRRRPAPDTSMNENADMITGFVCPGWPREKCFNGIVSYTTNMRLALRGVGARPIVMSRDLDPSCEDEDVIAVAGFEPPKNLFKRFCQRVAWKVAKDWMQHRITTDSILRTVERLHAEEGAALVQMEDSFGWAKGLIERSPIPVVVRQHGPWFLNGTAKGRHTESGYRQRVAAEDAATKIAHGISGPSQAVIDAVREHLGMPLPDAEAIPNPIFPAAKETWWRLDRCEQNRILFVGRFDRMKGGNLVIEAFAKVLEERPDARLTFVGPDTGFKDDDEVYHKIEPFVRERMGDALEDGRIEYMGFQGGEALNDLRRRALMTVVPSRYETFGNTATEALVLGCPVIAANTGGLAEIVQHERNGLQFEVGDSEGFATQILRYLNDVEFARRMGEQGILDCDERYHPDVIAERTIAFYRRVIEKHG